MIKHFLLICLLVSFTELVLSEQSKVETPDGQFEVFDGHVSSTYWDRRAKAEAAEMELIARKRFNENQWAFLGTFTEPLSVREYAMTQSLFHWIGVERKGGGPEVGAEAEFNARFFPNTKRQGVLAAIWSARQRSGDPDQPTQDFINRTLDFFCDLDYEQPDPDVEEGDYYGVSDGFCATDTAYFAQSGESLAEIIDKIYELEFEIMRNQEYKHWSCACAQQDPAFTGLGQRHFYTCWCYVAIVRQVLFEDCTECCSTTACSSS